MGPCLALSKTSDILQRAKGLIHGTAAFPPWQIICGLSVKKGWKQLPLLSDLMEPVCFGAGFQQSDDSLTLSHTFGLHQGSYSSLHQPKHVAPHVQGRELSSGRF